MAKIIVGVDHSPGSERALRWAAREASLRGAELVAVHAWGPANKYHGLIAEREDPDYNCGDATRSLERHVIAVLGGTEAQNVEQRLVPDLAANALLEAAEGADLLVVGSRGLGGFRGLLVGSVSQTCLHYATTPVAIVRADDEPAPPEESNRIIVGVDGSEGSRRALEWAISEARLRGAGVEAVHAWHMPPLGGEPYAPTAFYPGILEAEGRTTLQDAVAAVDTSGLTRPVDQVLVAGRAAAAVLDAAKGADLIVLGSRGRGGFAGLVLGSVSHHVAHHASCPVVVIPAAP